MSAQLPADTIAALERAFQHYPDPVRLLDANLRVLLENPASRELIPGGLGHLCGNEPPGQLCPSCEAPQVIQSGSPARWKVAAPRRGDPDARDYYEVTLFPVSGPDGVTAGVLELLRDETAVFALEHFLIDEAQRQEAEIHSRNAEMDRLQGRAEELRQSMEVLRESQAEAVYRDRLIALGRLVAGVSHEIHTPLGAVLSSADLLRRALKRNRDAGVGDPGRGQAMDSALDVVEEGARRIQSVVRMLRLYTRLDESEPKPTCLEDGLDSTLQLLGHLLGERIEIVREYRPLPEVDCRPDALNQVFMNLLANAIHAIPREGRIVLRTRIDGNQAVIDVEDNGTGITEEDLHRIFEAGYTTKRRGLGSGLGLAICRRIIEDHGGKIEATSVPGEGSTFTVRLPLRSESG